MPDFILLMHDDEKTRVDPAAWGPYLAGLRATGQFEGGSSIGDGIAVTKAGPSPAITPNLTGFIRVTADDIDAARLLLPGNPVYEAGGTVEIRELPRED